ncbi:MAG: hypothetical protein ABEJ65_09305 [bacterium]
MTEKPYDRSDWNELIEAVRQRDVRMGGYYEEAVRSVFFWAGPDNHPDNWKEDWEFFHGDKGLYPEKRAFIGWVATGGWSREGDDGFDHWEIRTRNIQALKAHRDDNDWQTTEIRSGLVNREEDIEWVREMFLELWNDVFSDRDDPILEVSDVAFEVPDHYPSYLQPETYRE